MFFHLTLEHEVSLHPKYFGPHLNETIKAKLFNEVSSLISFFFIFNSFYSFCFYNSGGRNLHG